MDQQSSDDEAENTDSILGRHEYWEQTYAQELSKFADYGDEGEIWFGDSVLETMLDWTDNTLQTRSQRAHDQPILDVGTGNGAFLVALQRKGYTDLTGSDYSEASVQLAEAIAAKRGVKGIRWIHDDFLDSRLERRYAVITDKGTLDAVGLMANATATRKRYRVAAWSTLLPGGLLIITSCNSTAAELKAEFCEPGDTYFQYVSHVKTYPVFRFGGVEGSKVCTVAFQKP